jgi:hypothetical protein
MTAATGALSQEEWNLHMLVVFLLLPLFFPFGPLHIGWCCPPWLFTQLLPSLEMPSQTSSEVGFTDFLGIAQLNNEDYASK